jgi:putative DNA methylase
LLKTRWLCKKDRKRVVLKMEPKADGTGVVFGVQNDVPMQGGNVAQRRENDKRLGAGTMSRSGVRCPCCQTIVTGEDIRLESQAGRLNAALTAVVVNGHNGKEFRRPTDDEVNIVAECNRQLPDIYASIPDGAPSEPIPQGASRVGG